MGNSRGSAETYAAYATTNLLNSDGTRKALHETFTRHETVPDFNPINITVRESRDSDANPNSRPIILALDVTGSMGMIAHELANEGIPGLMTGLYDNHGDFGDPHILCIAIGDHRAYDLSPVQATQFEADTKILEQLQNLHIEGGGGGNHSESYDLAWYFGARYTAIDSFEKRGIKGYLFTIGDEPPASDAEPTTPAQFKKLFKDGDTSKLSPSEMLGLAQEKYEVFHIVVEEGNYPRNRGIKSVTGPWRELLGNRVIQLNDYTQLAVVIRAVMAVNEGADPETILEATEGDKAKNAIRHALYGGTGEE